MVDVNLSYLISSQKYIELETTKMTRNNNFRPTSVQYEPKRQQYGKTKLTKTESMEAIDMGPMQSEDLFNY